MTQLPTMKRDTSIQWVDIAPFQFHGHQ